MSSAVFWACIWNYIFPVIRYTKKQNIFSLHLQSSISSGIEQWDSLFESEEYVHYTGHVIWSNPIIE